MENRKTNAPVPLPTQMRKRILAQLGIILGSSIGLGLSFNAYNPIGVRWSDPTNTVSSASAVEQNGTVQQNATTTVLPTELSPVTGHALTLPPLSTITWKEAKPLVTAGQVLLVDARGRATYDAGHIPQAISLPVESSPAQYAAFAAQYGKTTRLILYCGNLTCPSSEEVAKKLVGEYSFQSVLIMKGGYAEWQKAELGYDPTPTGTTWEQVEPLAKAGKVLLVDARPKALYDAGHITGAISLPESSTPEEVAVFQKQYDPKTPIVVYCSDLKCSLSMKLAVKLATWYHYQKIQYMPGGYQEWLRTQAPQAKPSSG
jgi:rhodanese-related sulfurtransferase